VPNPGNPQAWDRYAAMNNNPVKFVDPSGHCALLEENANGLCVRNDSNIQIVRGGSAFRNPTEKALANYILSGNENQLRNVPQNSSPGDINQALANVSLELGLKDESNPWINLLSDPNVILGSIALLAPEGNNKLPTGGVYTITNPNGEVVRVGRTNDFLRRRGEYGRDLDCFYLEFNPKYYTDDYATQRGLEQLEYDKYQPPMNVNRPISVTNKKGPGYLEAALEFLMNLIGGH
jgi:hypothetical protein